MGGGVKFNDILIHRNQIFGNLSIESFSDVFPLFLRDFTLITADKRQGFPVDGGASNVERAFRDDVFHWK